MKTVLLLKLKLILAYCIDNYYKYIKKIIKVIHNLTVLR